MRGCTRSNPTAQKLRSFRGSRSPVNEASSAAAESLLDAGVLRVVISLGAEGVFFADAEASGTGCPASANCESVTGAGDALMAGLVYAYLADIPTEEAVRFAVAAAGLAAASVSPVARDFSAATILDAIKKEAS